MPPAAPTGAGGGLLMVSCTDLARSASFSSLGSCIQKKLYRRRESEPRGCSSAGGEFVLHFAGVLASELEQKHAAGLALAYCHVRHRSAQQGSLQVLTSLKGGALRHHEGVELDCIARPQQPLEVHQPVLS